MPCRRMLLAFALVTLPTALSSRADVAGPDTVNVGLRKQLFVDDYVVASRTGLTRKLGSVTKANSGKPIFTEGRFYGTVLHDQDRFKMWFRENDRYGYAESSDGLRFQTKAQVSGIRFAGDVNLAVEIHPHPPTPEHRFLSGFDAPGMAAGIAHSPDGIHWTPYNQGEPVTFRAADSYNQLLWDDQARVYRLFTRTDYGVGGGPLAGTVAKSFEVRGTRSMVNTDIRRNPKNWTDVRQWCFNREGSQEYRRRQVYAMTVWPYEGVYFALLTVYEHPGDVSEGRTTDLVKRHERDVLNFYIATSRDATEWDLAWVYAGDPIVPRGPDRSFDKDIVFPSSTVVTHDDKHWFFYAGANERHGTEEVSPPVWFDRKFAIGLATLRLDGMIGLEASDETGSVTTKPFLLQGDHLDINADASTGSLRVGLLDADGKALAGYAGSDAAVLRQVDQVHLRPHWARHPDLKSLRGRAVRLQFQLRNAKLYAFQVL